jgi:hypothetical protein
MKRTNISGVTLSLNPAAFEASLLAHLEMTAFDFVDLAKKMRQPRWLCPRAPR